MAEVTAMFLKYAIIPSPLPTPHFPPSRRPSQSAIRRYAGHVFSYNRSRGLESVQGVATCMDAEKVRKGQRLRRRDCRETN